MANKKLSGAVGLRWRTVNVANLAKDQKTIIELLSAIPDSQGGQKGSWILPPPSGPNGTCPKILAEAIWSFQDHWKRKGLFKNIDGVVDPGMNTLRKMNELTPDAPPQRRPSELVSRTHAGWPHGHSTCPLVKDVRGDASGDGRGRITHIATPVNPKRTGRMISIGGVREVEYLGFKDFVPDPKVDKEMRAYWVHGRPFTTTIPNRSVSDICFRSVKIDHYMRTVELPRICAMGCRLTYAASHWDNFVKMLPYFRSIGPINHHEIIYSDDPDFAGWKHAWHVAVVTMIRHY